MINIKQQSKIFCTAKKSWTWMRPEARPIEFTNGHTCSYRKKKVDKSKYKYVYMIHYK